MTILKINELTLRPIEHGDAPRFAALCNDELLARNTSRVPFPYTMKGATNFVKRATRDVDNGKEIRFAVCRDEIIIACTRIMKTTPKVFELGYWVGAAARGQGVATVAASAICQHAFEELEARSIMAGYFVDNPASGRVLTKIGFKPTCQTIKTYSLGRGGEAETARMELKRPAFQPIQ